MEGNVSPFWQCEQLLDKKGLAVVFNFLNSLRLSSLLRMFLRTISRSFSMFWWSYLSLRKRETTFVRRSSWCTGIRCSCFWRGCWARGEEKDWEFCSARSEFKAQSTPYATRASQSTLRRGSTGSPRLTRAICTNQWYPCLCCGRCRS